MGNCGSLLYIHFNEVVTEDLGDGSGEIEEEVVSAELGNDTELPHEELRVVETHRECLVNKVLRDSAQSLQDGGQVFQDNMKLLAVRSVSYCKSGSWGK